MFLLFVAPLNAVWNVQSYVSVIRIVQHWCRIHRALVARCIFNCYNGPAVEVSSSHSGHLTRNFGHGFVWSMIQSIDRERIRFDGLKKCAVINYSPCCTPSSTP